MPHVVRSVRGWGLLLVAGAGLVLGRGLSTVGAPQEEGVPKPTAQHKDAEKDVGDWDATVRIFMPGQAEPSETKGSEKISMLGGLWQLSDFQSDMFGNPFQGRGQTGYDPKKGKYVGTWVDTFSTKVTLLEGSVEHDSRNALTPDDEKEGYILACQARPVGHVVVDI